MNLFDLPKVKEYGALTCCVLVVGMFLFPTQSSAQNTRQFQEVDFTPLQVRASTVDWGDFDNDGDLDLVVGGRINPDVKEMFIYRNDGAGSFTKLNAGLEGISEGGARWADIDGDQDLDLAAIGWNGLEKPTATIYVNQNNQNFEPLETNLKGVTYGSVDWADYDTDGDMDLIITGASDKGLKPSTTLYKNEGNNQFSLVDINLMGVWKGSADWGDFDGDGDPDLVLTGRDREEFPITVIYENKGDDEFVQVKADLMGVFGGSSSDWGDYDNDGDPDLLISGWNANMEPATIVYENIGNGKFETTGARLMGVNDGMAQWVDYDRDNALDIMVTGANADQEAVTRIYKNEPDTSFVLTSIALKGTWRSGFSWGDYNNDGYPDLVLSGADYYNERVTVIYENSSLPTEPR